MTAPVVEARGLVKRYGDTVAVNGVDFVVEQGAIYGALGPNGSGKSTTVRMLLGLVQPNEGSVRLFGQPLSGHTAELLPRVGAVVETPAFVPYLSGYDNLRLLRTYAPALDEAAVDHALARVHLTEASRRRFKNYSLGMKQRLGIAAAILHEPELIILDEPTNGLDPQGTREVRELIPELAAEGRTVVLCSHLLHEVEMVCQRVAIFQRGRVVADGPTAEIVRGQPRLRLRFGDMAAAGAVLERSPWSGSLTLEDGAYFVHAAEEAGAEVNRYLAAAGQYASLIQPVRQSLEDAFFELTGEGDQR
jgi:ABC-type multidrug transport system ATPase subunit